MVNTTSNNEQCTSPEIQMKLLSPFIWSKLSKDFNNKTGDKLELKNTILTKKKYKNNYYQVAKFNFECSTIICSVDIEYSNRILKNITKHKEEFENTINEAVEVLVEEYNNYKDSENQLNDEEGW